MLLFLALLPAALSLITCPDLYRNLYGNKCIRYLTDVPRTWEDARRVCQHDGGDLVSIHSEEEDDILFQMMKDPVWGKWIGLFANQTGGPLTWTDGTPIDYTNYSPDTNCTEGADVDSGYVMVVADEELGEWNCLETSLEYHAICEITGSTTVPPPTAPTDLCGNNSNYVFVEELNRCLRTQPTPQLWTDAEAACEQDGAHLVSIHNQEANDFLRRTALSNRFLGNVHIGAKVTSDLEAQWSDGSDFDYDNFHPGMPNSWFGDCVALETREILGTWANVECDLISLPFFCFKPVSEPVIPPLCPSPNVFARNGTVYSPNYPELDVGGFSCEYYFVVSQSERVELQFPQLTLVDGDSITLYDGIDTNEPFQVVISASPDDVFVSSTANSIRMVFQTDDTYGPRAWQTQFFGVTP